MLTRSCNILISLCLLFQLASVPAAAQSPVWEIEKNGRTMYVGGTLHLLTPQDYPLPAAFETAYRQSATVVFETDIARLESPEFQQYTLQQLSYGDGRNLRQVLRADTYQALVDFFSARGVPMTGIDNYKPGMVVMMMTMVELQRLGVVGDGVDSYFSERLAEDHKARGQLETAEEQVAFIANLGAGNEDAMLAYNLADMARMPELWQALKQAWRSGNIAALDELAAMPLRTDFPGIYRALLVDRNEAWMPQLEALAKSPQVEFVLVGALHLVGDDGLLAMLARRGYTVRQLP